MTQAYLVRIPGAPKEDEHRVFVRLEEGGSFLVSSAFGRVSIKSNRHAAPLPQWQPASLSPEHSAPYIQACREFVSLQQVREVKADMKADRLAESKRAALAYPYIVSTGRYDIPRVYRLEESMKGATKARIYDRKNDRWGKTLRPVPYRILAVMDEAAFACWRTTRCGYANVSVPLGELARENQEPL